MLLLEPPPMNIMRFRNVWLLFLCGTLCAKSYCVKNSWNPKRVVFSYAWLLRAVQKFIFSKTVRNTKSKDRKAWVVRGRDCTIAYILKKLYLCRLLGIIGVLITHMNSMIIISVNRDMVKFLNSSLYAH